MTTPDFELVDLLDFTAAAARRRCRLALGQYANEHTKAWAAKVAAFDGYVFVTPEYNHGTSAALKNAIDFLYGEWNNKAAGFVGYGSHGRGPGGGAPAAHLAEVQVATVRTQVALSLFTDFENFSNFKPADIQMQALSDTLSQTVAWSEALSTVRAGS